MAQANGRESGSLTAKVHFHFSRGFCPDGKSQKYIKESCIPEVYIGADYKGNNWLVGAGIEMVSLKPHTQSVVEDKVYKVDERITSLSYEVHMKYTSPVWYIAAKSILGSI